MWDIVWNALAAMALVQMAILNLVGLLIGAMVIKELPKETKNASDNSQPALDQPAQHAPRQAAA